MSVKVYNCNTDEMVDVTQEWCDSAQMAMNKMHKRNEVIKMVTALNIIDDKELIDELHTILWKAKNNNTILRKAK